MTFPAFPVLKIGQPKSRTLTTLRRARRSVGASACEGAIQRRRKHRKRSQDQPLAFPVLFLDIRKKRGKTEKPRPRRPLRAYPSPSPPYSKSAPPSSNTNADCPVRTPRPKRASKTLTMYTVRSGMPLCRRFRDRLRGPHRYSDAELDALIAWLRDPDPSREEWAAGLLQREGLIR